MLTLPHLRLWFATLALSLILPTVTLAQEFTSFIGTFVGVADETVDGETKQRDMSVTVAETEEGFSVRWKSIAFKADGRVKEQEYTVEFVPSQRDNIFGSAMKRNVFGKSVALDPLKGEPFVWARFVDDTFTVFSLFINEAGDYEMQEYHRTLAEGGLNLSFRRVRDGAAEKEITAFLKRQDG